MPHRRCTRTVLSYLPGCANKWSNTHYLEHSNWHPYRTGAAPCWVALSISTVGHVRACPGPASFRPQNCPFTCGDLEPHAIKRCSTRQHEKPGQWPLLIKNIWNVSQGGVATPLGYGVIVSDDSSESKGERMLKIDQYLTKLRAGVWWHG